MITSYLQCGLKMIFELLSVHCEFLMISQKLSMKIKLHVSCLMSLFEPSKFNHILRVTNTNVDCQRTIIYALTVIRDVGRQFAHVVCKRAEVDVAKRRKNVRNYILEETAVDDDNEDNNYDDMLDHPDEVAEVQDAMQYAKYDNQARQNSLSLEEDEQFLCSWAPQEGRSPQGYTEQAEERVGRSNNHNMNNNLIKYDIMGGRPSVNLKNIKFKCSVIKKLNILLSNHDLLPIERPSRSSACSESL